MFLFHGLVQNLLVIIGYTIVYVMIRRHYLILQLKYEGLLCEEDRNRMQQDLCSMLTLLVFFCLYSFTIVPAMWVFILGHISQITLYLILGCSRILQVGGIFVCLMRRMQVDMSGMQR